MLDTTEPYFRDLAIFALVLARVASLVLVAPVLGSVVVPFRLRAMLAIALAMLVIPIELAKDTALPASLPELVVKLGGEALVGLTLGLGVMVLFSGIQVAGQVISQVSGVQLADVVSPGFDTSLPLFSQLLFYVTLVVFLAIGGHRQVVEALLDTFAWLPAGQGHASRGATEAMIALVSQSFELGVRAAAPATVALILATLILGLASRALPQLNVLALGFGLNALVMLVMLGASLGAAAWVFQEQLGPALAGVCTILAEGPPAGSG